MTQIRGDSRNKTPPCFRRNRKYELTPWISSFFLVQWSDWLQKTNGNCIFRIFKNPTPKMIPELWREHFKKMIPELWGEHFKIDTYHFLGKWYLGKSAQEKVWFAPQTRPNRQVLIQKWFLFAMVWSRKPKWPPVTEYALHFKFLLESSRPS